MKLLFGFLLIICVIAVDELECEKKGFSSSLLCSSCDKLQAFVGETGKLLLVNGFMNRNGFGMP